LFVSDRFQIPHARLQVMQICDVSPLVKFTACFMKTQSVYFIEANSFDSFWLDSDLTTA